jgi:hypothetical protein
MPGLRFNRVPWLSWSSSGDRLAFFVRNEKSRTLILENVLTRNIDQRIEMRTVDEPESPDISPDGKKVAFAALQGGIGDIFVVDLESKQLTNLTKDSFGDAAPTWSPDGKYIVYVARVSGNDKLFRLDPDTGKKTQLTFGTHDDAGAQFLDADTLVFSSTATDPAQPIEPDVARNGNIYNIWTLNMKTGELRQYNRCSRRQRLDGSREGRRAATTHRVRELLQRRVRAAHAGAERSDRERAACRFRLAGPVIDFQHRSRTRWCATRSRRRAPSRSCSSTDGRRSTSA